MKITEALFSMADEAYREFHSKLMPTIDRDTIIGVRVPKLRAYGKSLSAEEKDEFLNTLPHAYYEENNLHAFLLNDEREFSSCMARLERFLPYVDNWATCDGLRPACVKKHKQELLVYIKKWLVSDHPYTIRFAIEMLMVHYLEEDFREEYPRWIASIDSNEYYVNMMIAWYFATALAKQYEAVVGYLEEKRLPLWVHNKTIQKAVESYRITAQQKAYLKTLK